MHVPDDSFTACRFLPKCVVDFRFTTLIAFEYTFWDFALNRVRHNVLS